MKSLVAVLIIIFTSWISYVDSIKSTERPSLLSLQHFKTKEGYVNILQRIEADYSDFATCLLKDEDGGRLTAIKASNNHKVKPIVQEIFNEWLKVSGDGSWADIVECLRHAQLNYLVSVIEKMYEDGKSTVGKVPDHPGHPGKSSVGEVLDHPGYPEMRNNFGLDLCSDITPSGELNTTLVCKKGISECIIGNPTARGLGIIITNDYNDTEKPLFGTCKDGHNLLETLVHSDFIVLLLHNINSRTISYLMDEVKGLEEHESREFIQKYECILFAFSGHGLNNKYIRMQDKSEVNIETDILKPLLPSSIRKFGEVPKVLLIDACRGSLETATVYTKSALDVITKDTIPAEGNYLLACATMPGHYSFMLRNGSFWMQEFAHLARKSTKSIEGVLINVNENLTKRSSSNNLRFQQPDMYVRLLKEVHIYHDTSTELSDRYKRTEL